jgi:hypothetical protein
MDATPQQIIERLRELGPDAIRQRLSEIDGEARALRTLLRSALYAERKKSRQPAIANRAEAK